MDYGKFVYKQVMRHVGSEAIKIHIAYPSFMCGIMLRKHLGILIEDEVKSSCTATAKISFSYKLFESHCC